MSTNATQDRITSTNIQPQGANVPVPGDPINFGMGPYALPRSLDSLSSVINMLFNPHSIWFWVLGGVIILILLLRYIKK